MSNIWPGQMHSFHFWFHSIRLIHFKANSCAKFCLVKFVLECPGFVYVTMENSKSILLTFLWLALNYFFMLVLLRRTSFLTPSMVYISVILQYTIQIASGPLRAASMYCLHLLSYDLLALLGFCLHVVLESHSCLKRDHWTSSLFL